MISPPAIPCKDMKTEHLVTAWVEFLTELKSYGDSKLNVEVHTPVTNGLSEMWKEVFEQLVNEHLHEVEEFAVVMPDDIRCRIIWAIAAWDPENALDGTSGSGMSGFVSARMIKDAVEHWLTASGGISFEFTQRLKTLNQLLCMMRCV